MKRYVSVLFFIITFILLFSVNVHAVDIEGYISSEVISDGNIAINGTRNSSSHKTSTPKAFINALESTLKKEYCEAILNCANDGFTNVNFINMVTIKGTYEEISGDTVTTVTYDKTVPITNIPTDFLDKPTKADDSYFEIVFKAGGKEYKLKTSTNSLIISKTVDGETVLEKVSKKDQGTDKYSNQYQGAENCKVFLKRLQDAANEGLVGGSIGAGYNVALPYSKTQRPLTDVLELRSFSEDSSHSGMYYYDFISTSDVDFTFTYYISPLFGEIYAGELPRKKEEWLSFADKYADEVGEFVKDGAIVVNSDFLAFNDSIAVDSVNSNGMRLADGLKIEGGAKRFNLAGSEDPKVVLSYNMPMYAPYVFSVTNGRGTLLIEALKKIEDYTFCLYDNNIYGYIEKDGKKEFTPFVSMAGTGTSHDYLYLYNQTEEEEVEAEDGTKKINKYKTGAIIIGLFDECVVDTTKGEKKSVGELTDIEKEVGIENMYLTGRKIGFDSSYSDVLDFNNTNVNVVFTSYDSGNKEAFNPKNIGFPVPGVDLKGYNLYDLWSGAASTIAPPEMTEKVKDIIKAPPDEEMIKYLFNGNNHGEIPKTCEGIKFYTGFAGFFGGKNVGASGEEIEQGSEFDTARYTFYIVRNNNYIDDKSLVSWLGTEKAKSLSYVKAEELLSKITGDFTTGLKETPYEVKQRMDEIAESLEYDKNNWLVRLINTSSIIMGVFLIIFAILFMLFYWIDIFNTFMDFSFLKIISFGNLYPVADKTTIDYLRNAEGNDKIRFVTFKDVIIIAVIMMIMGIFFINSKIIIGLIVKVYTYLLDILGGV